jgi:3'-phosphoadenosine 5'-phosphosulfate sulfotransferase (PAPS reductase)/FAD synthetase
MQKALKDMKAWISGIRRDQTTVRSQAKILERQPGGLLKINPMLNWTKADVKQYVEENHLPSHPLFEKGYRSVGCGKTECGLHTEMFQRKTIAEMQKDFQLDVSLTDK